MARRRWAGGGLILRENGQPAETVLQSGDGRDVMTRPVGAIKVSSSLAFPLMDQPELCSR